VRHQGVLRLANASQVDLLKIALANLSIWKLFANLAWLPEIKCEWPAVICEWLALEAIG
jgi:hypothetical protein